MENINIQTTQNIEIAHNIAGVGDRVLATILDLTFMLSYTIIMLGSLTFTGFSGQAINIIFIAIPLSLYHLVCEISFNGQSLGKKIMKIRVIMLDGSQPANIAYFLRWILRLADISVSIGAVAILTIIFSKKGQRLGDLAAGTTVVKRSPLVTIESLLMKTEANYEPVFPQVSGLSEKDISILRELIDFCKKEGKTATTVDMVWKARRNIEKKIGTGSGLKDYEFIVTILKDYNAVNG
jgi:uncharacterized RDD family membrane protein YckC